jgi:hypothetical protein
MGARHDLQKRLEGQTMYQLLVNLWTAVTIAVALLKSIVAAQVTEQIAIQVLNGKLDHVIDLLTPKPAVKFIIIAEVDGWITYGAKEIQMTDTQQAILTIEPVDKKGNPAQLDGPPEWASSNTEVITVTAAADGLSAVALAVGPLGTATVSVKADGDLGPGVTTISGTIDITVTGGGAVTLKIAMGTPTEQGPVAPPIAPNVP